MVTEILTLLAGLALVVLGADWLVDGSSAVARRAGLSEFVIGLTIVGIGTSSPELVVSLSGALKGNADIAIGNVIGSNIFNTLFILGFTALLRPVAMTRDNVRMDIPVNVDVSALLILFGMRHTLFGIGNEDILSKTDGIIFLTLFAAYLYWSFKSGKSDGSEESGGGERKMWVAALMIAGGLAALIFGGDMFVDSAADIARRLEVSDKFIAVTILAGGTSMPEFVTCVVAAAKKKGQLALGNILGSNICNILLILGASALAYRPMADGAPSGLSFAGMSPVDLCALLFGAVFILITAFIGKGRKMDRMEGGVSLALFAGYMTYLFINL